MCTHIYLLIQHINLIYTLIVCMDGFWWNTAKLSSTRALSTFERKCVSGSLHEQKYIKWIITWKEMKVWNIVGIISGRNVGWYHLLKVVTNNGESFNQTHNRDRGRRIIFFQWIEYWRLCRAIRLLAMSPFPNCAYTIFFKAFPWNIETNAHRYK